MSSQILQIFRLGASEAKRAAESCRPGALWHGHQLVAKNVVGKACRGLPQARSRARSPGETPAGDDCQKNLLKAFRTACCQKNLLKAFTHFSN